MLPKNICATCFLKIESIDKFAYSAAKNQECFLTWIQNNQNAKNLDQNVTQTTIETSTNSDFSFCNITIKKEFNQRQQIIFQPQKSRNSRHVDHVTLEQIINDQIIKNPKLPASTTITKIDEPKRPRVEQHKHPQQHDNNTNISIMSYNNIQIGQVIKDHEFLKLILRALKWEEYDRKTSYNELMERLKRSYCRDILTNKNLLSDNDVVQLLRSTLNDSVLSNLKMTTTIPLPSQAISKVYVPQSVIVSPASSSVPSSIISSMPKNSINLPPSKLLSNTQNSQGEETIEVSINPEMMYLDDTAIVIDDNKEKEESNALLVVETKNETSQIVTTNETYICSSCPQKFTSSTELQNHVTNHLISSPTSTSSSLSIATTNKEANQENNIAKGNNKSAIIGSEDKTLLKKKKIVRHLEKIQQTSQQQNIRPKRKSFVLKINPSPNKLKRHIRERSSFRAHQLTTTNTQFTCSICTKTLSSKRNLQLHIETHKSKNGKFLCDAEGCKKFFGKMENVVKHKLEAHEKSTRRKRNQNER